MADAMDLKSAADSAVERDQGTHGGHHLRFICMINPNNDNLTRDEPLPMPLQSGEGEVGSSGREQFRRAQSKFSTAMSHTWEGKIGRASCRERVGRVVGGGV